MIFANNSYAEFLILFRYLCYWLFNLNSNCIYSPPNNAALLFVAFAWILIQWNMGWWYSELADCLSSGRNTDELVVLIEDGVVYISLLL